MKSAFEEMILKQSNKVNSLLCIGLDSDAARIPVHLQKEKFPQFIFNREIIENTHECVCAYKFNSAFYEARGAEGITALKKTCDLLKKTYRGIPVILDAKRADIGNTNNGYVQFAFEYLGADAITLHPYLGYEALRPFLDRADKGCIILCRTSNPGAGEFQDALISGKPLYEVVARKVAGEWNTNANCLLVIGATYPKELACVRSITPDMTFLIPGIGRQGGDVEKVVTSGLNAQKSGLIINASRSIIFASTGRDFGEASEIQAQKLRDEINRYR